MKVPTWLMALLRSSPVILLASATRLLLVANDDPVVATKIASSGGVTGTLLGTLIPLLPVYLPLIVVALIIARRLLLALVAIGAMVLVTPSHVTWSQWLHHAQQGVHEIEQWEHNYHLPGWHAFFLELGRYLVSVVHDQWPLWVGGAACLIAVASAPARLRITDTDDLKKTVDQRIKDFTEGWTETMEVGKQKEFKEGKKLALREILKQFYVKQRSGTGKSWTHEITIGDELYFLPLDKMSDFQFKSKLHAALSKPLLDTELKNQRYRPLWRTFYGVRLGIAAIVLVGLVMQFYMIPITGIDPGQIARSMWLPSEKITVAGQSQPTVGYVLSTSDSWFVVLTEQNRTIEYLKASDVTGRSVCALDTSTSSGNEPLVKLAGTTNPDTPLCFPKK